MTKEQFVEKVQCVGDLFEVLDSLNIRPHEVDVLWGNEIEDDMISDFVDAVNENPCYWSDILEEMNPFRDWFYKCIPDCIYYKVADFTYEDIDENFRDHVEVIAGVLDTWGVLFDDDDDAEIPLF